MIWEWGNSQVSKLFWILTNFLVKLSMAVKYRNITPYYHTIFNISRISVCHVLNGTSSHPIMTWLIDMLFSGDLREIIHPCPYFGKFRALNMTLNKFKYSIQFPNGEYSAITRFYSDQDKNMFTFKHMLESRDYDPKHLRNNRKKNNSTWSRFRIVRICHGICQ